MQPLALSPLNGHCLAAGFLANAPYFALADGTVHIWNDERNAITAHEGLLAVDLRGDRAGILTGGEDGRVCQIAKDGTVAELARVPRKWITAVASGFAGAFAYAAARNVWLHDGTGSVQLLEQPSAVQGLAFSSDGKRLAVARYNGVGLYALGATAEPEELFWKSMNTKVTFSPSGRFLMVAMRETGLHGWLLPDRVHFRMLGYAASVADWSWSAHGDWLATSGASAAIVWPFDKEDGPMGKKPLELGARDANVVTAVAFHPSRNLVAVGYDDGLIQAVPLDFEGEAVLHPGSIGKVTSLAWDIAGARIAFGTANGECGVIDVAS